MITFQHNYHKFYASEGHVQWWLLCSSHYVPRPDVCPDVPCQHGL